MLNVSIVTYLTNPDEVNYVVNQCLSSPVVENIYIIDNSPYDNLKHDLIFSSKVSYIHNPANPGYGASHNLAMKKSIAAGVIYHLVINADVVFKSELLKKMTEFGQENLDIGLFAPKMFFEDGSLQFSRRLLPNPMNMLSRAFLPTEWRKKMDKNYQLEDIDQNVTIDVPFVSGAFMLFRCEELKKIGLFDERFFMYAEDIDISRRFYSKSRVLYLPQFHVIHKYGGATFKSMKMFAIHVLNMIRYFNKWGWFFDYERRSFNSKTLKQKDLYMKEL